MKRVTLEMFFCTFARQGHNVVLFPGVSMQVPQATYLAWLDWRALELSCSAGQFFLDQARVGLSFGEGPCQDNLMAGERSRA